jgi:hypothetical protein
MQRETTSRTTAIVVNGEDAETRARTLAELVADRGFAEGQVATALNRACPWRQGRDRGAPPGRLIGFCNERA